MNSVSLKAPKGDAENFLNDGIVTIIIMVTVNVLSSSDAWSVLSTFICVFSFNPPPILWGGYCYYPHFTGGKIGMVLT